MDAHAGWLLPWTGGHVHVHNTLPHFETVHYIFSLALTLGDWCGGFESLTEPSMLMVHSNCSQGLYQI